MRVGLAASSVPIVTEEVLAAVQLRRVTQTVMVDVVFVVGLSIEVAGAALLAAGQIRLVDRTIGTRPKDARSPDAPRREAQREAARFTVGFAFLAAGVVVQLVGYAIDGGWWLLGLAIGVIFLAAVVGRVIADAPVTAWLHRRAVDFWESERGESDS